MIESIIRKIEALLNTKGCTEAEAGARTEKAQELLEKYNLDMAQIGAKEGANHRRKDTRKTGGLYGWQRDLWSAVASLNFCHHISIKGTGKGSKYEHRIIGSHVNVVSTEVMAQYLQDTIERLAQEWSRERGYTSVFVRDAIAFREGAAMRVCNRLAVRRDEQVQKANKAKAEEEARAKHPSYTPTSNAVTIVDVMGTEADLNNDYLNGLTPGTTAERRREHALARMRADENYREMVRKQKEEDEANDDTNGWEHGTTCKARMREQAEASEAWYKEYLFKQAKKAKRRATSEPRERAPTEQEKRRRLSGFYEGAAKGEDIGLDKQISEEEREKLR